MTAASVTLDASYSDGSNTAGISVLDFGASVGDGISDTWTQRIAPSFPIKVIRGAKVGTRTVGKCLFSPV